jgi:hypothetical protein
MLHCIQAPWSLCDRQSMMTRGGTAGGLNYAIKQGWLSESDVILH